MNARFFWTAVAAGALQVMFAADAPTAVMVQVDSGTVHFESSTNVSAVSVHGKSGALKASVRAQKSGDGLVLERIEAWVPVKTLTTGISLRDEHMRKDIFTTSDGGQPDLRFTGENLHCPAQPGRETSCQVNGNLSVRGVDRPFSLTLKIKEVGSQFKVAGEAKLKLSDYGIERPSQAGVKAEDDVDLRLEFSAKETPVTARAENAR